MSVSPALCPRLAFRPVLHANLCPALPSHYCLLPICVTACPLPFFFCTMLKPWNQETGILDGSQINLEIAVKHRPEQTLLTAERSVVLLLTTCSLLFNTWRQSAFNSDVNKSCFSDCEVSAKHGFWDWRSCSLGPACLVYPLGDVTQQAPLKGSSTTVLHFEDTLKNPLSGTRECDDLMCHTCEQ